MLLRHSSSVIAPTPPDIIDIPVIYTDLVDIHQTDAELCLQAQLDAMCQEENEKDAPADK